MWIYSWARTRSIWDIVFDLVDYLQPELEKNLGESERGIYLFLTGDVTYDNPWERLANHDDEYHDVEPFTLHSVKLKIKNRDQLAEQLEKAGRKICGENEGPIRAMPNFLFDSIGRAC